MRYFLIACLLGFTALTATGCILPAYSADPQRRIRQEMYDAENMRQAQLEWERMMMVDKASSLTMDRLSGAVM